jgi:hypothetical protein
MSIIGACGFFTESSIAPVWKKRAAGTRGPWKSSKVR